MVKVLVWEDGKKVIREAVPGDIPDPPTSAELDALAEILATEVAESDAKFKVLARLIFELAKAQKTGDLSFFDSVTDAATYKALLVSMFRANL